MTDALPRLHFVQCLPDDVTDVIDQFHLSMETFSAAKKITFAYHIGRGIFEKIRNVLQWKSGIEEWVVVANVSKPHKRLRTAFVQLGR